MKLNIFMLTLLITCSIHAMQKQDIFQASAAGNLQRVKELLDEKKELANDADPFNSNATPLHEAARSNHHLIALLLLERGAHVNQQDNNKNTPLHYAASDNALEVADILLLYGAQLNTKGYKDKTPLGIAQLTNAKNMIAWLKDKGAQE